jgi:hypothetical protein
MAKMGDTLTGHARMSASLSFFGPGIVCSWGNTPEPNGSSPSAPMHPITRRGAPSP